MTDALRDFLARGVREGENCGLFIARWLREAGVSDLADRLDMPAVRAVERDGGALAFASDVFAREGFVVTESPSPGDPVCVAADGGETLAILVNDRWRATVADGGRVGLGRWPLLRAWRKREAA